MLLDALDGVHVPVGPSGLGHQRGGVAQSAADLEEPSGAQGGHEEGP